MPLRWLLSILALVLLAPPSGPAHAADEPVIRVGLFSREAPREIVVRGHEGGLDLYVGDAETPVQHLDEGTSLTVKRERDQLRLELPEGALYALNIRLEPDAAFAVAVTEGASTVESLAFDGVLNVAPSDGAALQLVNHIALEQYVASVLGSEYGLDDIEGNKAMAVAIRTYALRSTGKHGDDIDHVDNVMSQHYRGLKYVSPATLSAARATGGEVLTYDGELIEAVYFSSSGGHTADNEAVWDGDRLPYLRGRPDPFDEISPHQSWRSTVSRSRLLNVLSRESGRSVRGFLLGDESADGRIQTIELLHDGGRRTTMQANRFRLLVNQTFGHRTLMSTLFTADRRGSQYVFEGQGYGHGVGLSQWGAHGMAREGHSYRDILAYYYTGVSLRQHDGTRGERLATPAVASASDTPSSETPSPEPRTETPDTERTPPAETSSPTPTQSSAPDSSLADKADKTDSSDSKPPPTNTGRRIGW